MNYRIVLIDKTTRKRVAGAMYRLIGHNIGVSFPDGLPDGVLLENCILALVDENDEIIKDYPERVYPVLETGPDPHNPKGVTP